MKNSNYKSEEVRKKSLSGRLSAEKRDFFPFFTSVLRSFTTLFSFILPGECPLCGRIPADGSENFFCKECLDILHFVRSPLCSSCGGELSGILEMCPDCLHTKGKRPWKKALALFVMEGKVREIIYRYKYRKETALARPLGMLCAEKLLASGLKADVITYTPLHWTRCLMRGYNQAELLAKEISKHTDLPVERLLKRKRLTRQQARLKRKERIKNMQNAFSALSEEKIRNKKILLVDDVLTTGATLSSATEELLRKGAEEVYILVAARRQSDHQQ